MIKPIFFLILGLSAISSSCFAQARSNDSSEDQSQWYQIELLIFAYNGLGLQGQEVWPREPGLKYPERITELSIAGQTNNTPENSPLASSNANNSPSNGMQSAQQTAAPATVPARLKEQPFTLLEPHQLTLSNAAKRLFRQNDITPLFHGAWRQPVASRERAISTLIRGGKQFDNHYELEGSITIGLERYLHINTDLWLSSFVSNNGTSDRLWPVLPQPPTISNAPAEPVGQLNNETAATDKSSVIQDFKNPFTDLIDNQYAVDQTVVLRQQRRMRSSELHYIDHPLMGLLVRITPYKRP